jgi:UDP:flavonoid glycosyltransferase YjiC (YdhE family)
MRLLLSTYDSRGGVEPLVGLAVRVRAFGADVRLCAPSDCAERLVEVGVPLVGSAQDCRDPGHRGRATAMAGTIRTDGATVAATRLLDRS